MHVGLLRVSLLYVILGIILVRSEVEYQYVNRYKTWEEARQYCREHYTDLATLENDKDLHSLAIPSGTSAWIGLFDDPASWRGAMTADSNSWRWSATGTTSPGGYQNWASSDPDNARGNQYCVYFENGHWFDQRCTKSFYFLCDTVQPSGSKDYILITTAKNWTSAQVYCRQHYHDLATIETSAENQAVSNLLSTTTSPVWIGLYRTPWTWSDGSHSAYRMWSPGEPNNARGVEHCAIQSGGYTWNDAPCGGKASFICHKAKKMKTTTKMRLQTTANLHDPAVRDKLLKAFESHFGVGFKPSWIIPPAKEEKKPTNEVCASYNFI